MAKQKQYCRNSYMTKRNETILIQKLMAMRIINFSQPDFI